MSVTTMSHITVVGSMALGGYYIGNLVRRIQLPSIIGYMLVGVLIGPPLLGMLDEHTLETLSFVSEIALAFVAFSIGAELKLSSLKELGFGIVSIIFAESFTAFFVVFGAIWLLTGNLPLALVFGAVAPASAPAGTVAVIREYRARGPLTQALYAVVGFDDGLAIIIFGFASALAQSILIHEATGGGSNVFMAMVEPLREICLSIALGFFGGYVFCLLVRSIRNPSYVMIVFMGCVLILTGISIQFHLSLILTNMIAGMVLVNTRREEFVYNATSPLRLLMPMLFVLFFSMAGAHLDIKALPSLGLIGLVYIAARTVGLISGARIGSAVGNVAPAIKEWIGLGILSQAGVAIGLAIIVQSDFGEIARQYPEAFAALAKKNPLLDPIAIGSTIITTVTATCIVFELFGPMLTKIALTKAGEIGQAAE